MAFVLDDGVLCVGLESTGTLGMVAYTDAGAIRFVDRRSAESLHFALPSMGFNMMARRVEPREHSWR